MEKGEISSDSELAPLVLEVPTIDWTIYNGVKGVQYIKMGERVQANELNSWDRTKTPGKPKKNYQRISNY